LPFDEAVEVGPLTHVVRDRKSRFNGAPVRLLAVCDWPGVNRFSPAVIRNTGARAVAGRCYVQNEAGAGSVVPVNVVRRLVV
jgi:hypothetical protein